MTLAPPAGPSERRPGVLPTFASWREGVPLDVGDWLTPKNGRTPAIIVSVAHLDDEERALVLGVLLEEVLSWVRTLRGTSRQVTFRGESWYWSLHGSAD